MSDRIRPSSWEALHQGIIEMLAAYVDGELDASEVSVVEAHLAGCARCRNDVALQSAIARRLREEPVEPAPPAFLIETRERLRAAAKAQTPPPSSFVFPSWGSPRLAWAASGWLVAAAALLWIAFGSGERTGHDARHPDPAAESGEVASASIPMIQEAVEDFVQQIEADRVEGKADLAAVERQVGLPVRALRGPGVQLLAARPVQVRGTPAAAIAYRVEDRIVIQYVVSKELFFRQPDVREAIADRGMLFVREGRANVVAWPVDEAGVLLVGHGAPERLERLAKGKS